MNENISEYIKYEYKQCEDTSFKSSIDLYKLYRVSNITITLQWIPLYLFMTQKLTHNKLLKNHNITKTSDIYKQCDTGDYNVHTVHNVHNIANKDVKDGVVNQNDIMNENANEDVNQNGIMSENAKEDVKYGIVSVKNVNEDGNEYVENNEEWIIVNV